MALSTAHDMALETERVKAPSKALQKFQGFRTKEMRLVL